MITSKNEGIILSPSSNHYETKGVLNPACVEIDGIVHMFYRAVSDDDVSTIGYCQLKDDEIIMRRHEPFMKPEYTFESMGLEDPRITYLDGLYYLIYTAYDGKNAAVAYATATPKKFPNFEKQGLITPNIRYHQAIAALVELKLPVKYRLFEHLYEESRGDDILLWEKDIVLFPEKVNGKFCLMHRILPEMQIIYFSKFSDLTTDFWKKYLLNLDKNIILKPEYWYETRNIGGGCPPIKTPYGWLIIYHAVEDSSAGHIYRAGVALLDLKDPTVTLAHLPEPLFSPTFSYEKNGVVNNVVFPTSAFLSDGRLDIYYGAGDKVIAKRSLDLEKLLTTLRSCPPQGQKSLSNVTQ